jgi:hypothetical protein
MDIVDIVESDGFAHVCFTLFNHMCVVFFFFSTPQRSARIYAKQGKSQA